MKVVPVLMRALAALTLAGTSVLVNAQSLGPTLDRIAERGVIFLGHRESSVPFSYLVPGREEPEGFSIEVCGHVAKAIEEKIGKKIVKKAVVVSPNTRIMMIKTGMADIECGVTTNTIGRAQQVAFSNTIFVSEVKAMVPVALAEKRLADLADKRVISVLGATADRLIKQASMSRGISLRASVARDHSLAMAALTQGNADIYVADDAILLGMRAAAKNPENFVLLPDSYSVEPYGLVLARDDPQFKKVVDEALITLMKSGEMERIYNHWFMAPIPPNNAVLNYPISPLNKATYSNPNDKSVN